jgi:hypothetical protein
MTLSRNVPSGASITPTNTGLANFSHWTKEYLLDKRLVEYFNYQTLGNVTTAAAAAQLANVSAGAAPMAEINSSDVLAQHLDTGDTFNFIWRLPEDMDVSKDVEFYVLWSSGAAAAAGSTAVFLLNYRKIVAGSTAVAAATSLMTSNSGATIGFGANVPGWSPANVIGAGNINTMRPGLDLLVLEHTLTLATLTSADLWMGLCLYSRLYA